MLLLVRGDAIIDLHGAHPPARTDQTCMRAPSDLPHTSL